MSNTIFKNFIQVAGVIDQKEADLLIESGIKYLGFPLRLPVNKEDLSEKEAAQIIKTLPADCFGVVISYSSTANEVIELCDKIGVNIIQLHGPITVEELNKIRSAKHELKIIKSLIIKKNNEKELINLIEDLEPFVDAFITDTFDFKTGASGATGKTHDWSISKRFAEISSKPVILAGGLNPENVNVAILQVKPAGVDVHTGIENNFGRKDRELLQKFIQQSNLAFNEMNNGSKRI